MSLQDQRERLVVTGSRRLDPRGPAVTGSRRLDPRGPAVTGSRRLDPVGLSLDHLALFVSRLVAESDRWEHLVRHSSDERVYERIWDDELVNAWLICWSEDQDTGFHDHDESGAAIAVLSGQVREERLRLGAPTARRVVGPGFTVTIPPVAIHRVLHAGSAPAVTIHAYSPPLVRQGVYTMGAEGELERCSVSVEEELRAEAELAGAASITRSP